MIQRNPSSRPTVIQRLWGYGLSRSSVLADHGKICSYDRQYLKRVFNSPLCFTIDEHTCYTIIRGKIVQNIFCSLCFCYCDQSILSFRLNIQVKKFGLKCIQVMLHTSNYYYTSFEKICYKVSKTKNNIILPEIIYLFIQIFMLCGGILNRGRP